MKKSLKILLLSTVLMLPVVSNAADTNKAKQEVKAEQPAPDVAAFDKQMAEAQKNMQKMHEQMAKISATQDPQERQKLLKAHFELMQTTMPMMRGMMGSMGCPMMGGNMMSGGMMKGMMDNNNMMNGNGMMDDHMMGWSHMNDYYSKLTPEQIKQRQYMMDNYMGMQNMMMDNMMQHQNLMMQPNMMMQPTQ